jgi:hypothetical protein
MVRGILIAGDDSALSRAIEIETAKYAEHYAAALIPNRLTGANSQPKTVPETENARIEIEWNPSSPISARTLVLSACNRLENIDEAILVCSPPSIRCAASDLQFTNVDILLNDHIKGWFFLVKELAAVFSERRRGVLSLVYSDNSASSSRDEAADLLGPCALAAFRALTGSLLVAAVNDPYITIGFSNSDAGNEAAFASFMYKHIDEASKRSSGKLHKFGKFSFFK